MKEEILKLRAEGKTYNQIKEILNCSKSTISYYCGEGQKEKTLNRERKRRKETVISRRVEKFQYDRKIKDKSEDFQRKREFRKLGKRTLTFKWQDVIAKFGWQTNCYLTGKPINLKEPLTYHFDHKIPYSKGGSSSIDNLGIACKEANLAKSDMSVEELIEICKRILEFNGYEIMAKV